MRIQQKATTKTVNKAGAGAFTMNDKETLVSGVLNSLYNEKKFYGDNTKELNDLAIQMLQKDPEFVAKLTVYAREKFNLRTFPTVLASLVSMYAPDYTQRVMQRVITRPDQLREMVAFFNQLDPSGQLAKRGKSIRGFKKLKKAVESVLNTFDEYQLQKWDSSSGITLANVLRIFHPKLSKPELGKMILEKTLPTAYTWETELSTKGNKAQVWEELIASKKLPYMAMLRNLRNIINAGVSESHLDIVANFISNKEAVLRSKQFPYRFLSAIRELDTTAPRNIIYALNNAMEYSLDNLEPLPGKSVIAVDLSGSMNVQLSDKSKVTRIDVACYTAAILFKKYNSVVIGFSNDARILNLNPADSISTIANSISASMHHGATNAHLVIDLLKTINNPARVIFITDMQFWDTNQWVGITAANTNTFHKLWSDLKLDAWMHMIDLTGYGTHVTQGGKLNFICGWSDNALTFLSRVESGTNTLVQEINAMEL